MAAAGCQPRRRRDGHEPCRSGRYWPRGSVGDLWALAEPVGLMQAPLSQGAPQKGFGGPLVGRKAATKLLPLWHVDARQSTDRRAQRQGQGPAAPRAWQGHRLHYGRPHPLQVAVATLLRHVQLEFEGSAGRRMVQGTGCRSEKDARPSFPGLKQQTAAAASGQRSGPGGE